MRTKRWFIISLMAVLSMILAACAQPTAARGPADREAGSDRAAAAPTKAPEPTTGARTHQAPRPLRPPARN